MVAARKKELEILNNAVRDNKSHFIVVYGRRRVGKTFLLRETFGERFTFQHSGIYNKDYTGQLHAFYLSLVACGHDIKKPPANWLDAFHELKNCILSSTESKKIIFIDELSWMDTQKSGLITALEWFWNGFASGRKDIVLIVCSSATSWMISKIIHNKGGLYNRLTDRIRLEGFTLAECEEYVHARGLILERKEIMEYYMVFGGIPYYWEYIQKGLSVAQNIDNILFSKDAPLKNEFKYLYASIFNNPEQYIQIVETLGKKKAGMTRDEIIQSGGLHNSGNLSGRLEELEQCGFIRKFKAFGAKSKGSLYQLTDYFTLFYYQFLEDEPTDPNFWANQYNTPRLNTWRGLAFERICLMHIDAVKNKLGIRGVMTDVNSWQCKADPDKGIFGSQIDLLIVRKDGIINLCEIKYSGVEYTVTAKFDEDMRHKINDLRIVTKTKCAIHPTVITCYGLLENTYSRNVQAVVTMEDLFKEN